MNMILHHITNPVNDKTKFAKQFIDWESFI